MIYATGGAAFTHTRLESTRVTSGVPTAYSSSATAWTWTVGAGVETAVWDRWTVKAEYLRQGPPHGDAGRARRRRERRRATDILRAGVNYRF